MKKLVSLLLTGAMGCALLAACAPATVVPSPAVGTPAVTAPAVPPTGSLEGTIITVAASPTPHAEILKIAAEVLAKQGITLTIQEFTDYIVPNTATEDGQVDANYFQHITYMNDFNEKNATHLANVAEIHYEPFGLYAGKTSKLEALADGAKVAVPNDPSNEARALLLLQSAGLIKLKDGVGLAATKLDIVENTKKLDIVEMEAAQLPRTLTDVDLAVINGNYALDAGLKVADALSVEDKASEATKAYVNVLAVKEGRENDPAILALVAALKSEEVRTYINDTFGGAVVPMF